MIRCDAGPAVDKALHDRIRGPAENSIEAKYRESGRERLVVSARWKFLLERVTQRSRPEPIIKIPEHDGHHGMAACDLDQPPRLRPSLREAQSKMSRDQAQVSNRRVHLRLDGAPGLPILMREVMDLGSRQRPAAHHHLAVVAVRRDDGFRFDAMLADRLPQQLEGGASADVPAT